MPLPGFSRRIFAIAVLFQAMLGFPAIALDVGVGTHMGQGKYPARTVQSALNYIGASGIRDEVYWDKVELSKGQYGTERIPSSMKSFLNEQSLQKQHNSVLALGYGNPLYEAGARPVTDQSRAAFAEYAGYVARRFGSSIGFLEIWNEWNLATGYRNGVRGQPGDYADLVKTVVPVIRNTRFAGKILIGGIGGDHPDWAFTRTLLTSEILDMADGYSVHLYNFARSGQPDEMISRLERLQQVLSSINRGKPYPVYVTEVGWPNHTGKHGMTEEEAAAKKSIFIAEAARLDWLKGVWLYELIDSGPDKASEEHNFGIFYQNGEPKSSACALRGMIGLVKEARFKAAGNMTGATRWLQFETGTDTYFVFYSTSPGRGSSTIKLKKGVIQAIGSLCDFPDLREGRMEGAADSRVLDVMPVIVRIGKKDVDFQSLVK